MRYISASIIILAVLLICEIVFEMRTFRVRQYELHVGREGIEEKKRIVFLSDLHNCVYGAGNQKLLKAVREQKPDLILIGGDMLVGKRGVSSEEAKQFVLALPTICPVYYAYGNHEQRLREMPEYYGDYFQEYQKELEKGGVHFLENETAELLVDRLPVRISGFTLPDIYYKRGNRKRVTVSEIEACIGTADQGMYQIMLAHNPVHMERYWNWGADLVLSGHLHGGIIRIPRIGGVITPQFGLFPKYSGGKYEHDGKACVVSQGIGTHSVPVRLFNRAELVVIDLAK